MGVAKRSLPPLDAVMLEKLALRYVERFATTRSRLTAYLNRKIHERGFAGEAPETAALAERLAQAGYIDDRAFGEARARTIARRGLGARRVAIAFRQAGIDDEDSAALEPEIADRAIHAAIAFARRRRIGPFGTGKPDRQVLERQIAAMIRGGHDFAIARKIAGMTSEADLIVFDEP